LVRSGNEASTKAPSGAVDACAGGRGGAGSAGTFVTDSEQGVAAADGENDEHIAGIGVALNLVVPCEWYGAGAVDLAAVEVR